MDLILKFVQVGTNLIKVLLDIGIYLDKKKEKTKSNHPNNRGWLHIETKMQS